MTKLAIVRNKRWPAALPKFGRNFLAGAIVVAVAAGCDGDPTDTVGLDELDPRFQGGVTARATGSGRVDYPPGDGEKNPSNVNHQYQTFGFNIRVKDGVAEGQVQVVDHRDSQREFCGERPCNWHSVSIDSFEDPAPADECEATNEGAVVIRGKVIEKNTSSQRRFRLTVCDHGEPGSKTSPQDRFEFFVEGFTDSDTAEYCIREVEAQNTCTPFDGDDPGSGVVGARGALLTGGNEQVMS